ncbi:tachykinin-like peptides receptor 86C [Sitodiplosis mosellana]|uniref:tachykinin-like peptides receptor 86C n=1 Tax=Sitodiplosis mosellana TaxID=263140 RepID=UPI002444DC8F|nr:tachykinin-like peptides receptor 86C [Sitodiplosis mosellana]
MCVFAVFLLFLFSAHREMRTITNYFLLNLSVADLMMSSLNCMFNFIYMLNSDWPFGRFYCSLNNFLGNVTVATSVFTLVAISFDRYVAIVRPLHRRNSRKKARMFVIIIWVLSSMLSLPCLFYSTTEAKVYQSGKQRVVCFISWPDGRYPTSLTDYVYNCVFLVLTYGVPMLIMIVSYTIMGRVLWGSQSIGEHTQRQIESIKSKKKVVRMFIAVVTIFGICWLPYHLFYVYSYHRPHITSSNYVPHLFLAFYWLAMANSMVNPIIYYWMNRRFRHYFQKIMCFCCFHLWQQNELLKSETVYMPNSMSIERRSKSFRQRYNNSIRLSEINNHSTKTLQQVLYVRDNKLKTESMFVECFDSPVGASSLNFA